MNNNNYFAYNISANNSLPSEAIMLGHDDNNNNNNIQIKKQKKKHSVNMNIRKGGANNGKFLKLSAILRDNSNNKLKNKNSVNNSMSTKTRNVSFGKQNNETTPLQSIMNNSNTNNNNTNHTNINIIHVNNANTNKTINLTATMNNNAKPPFTYNTNTNTNTNSNNNNKQLKTRHSKSKNNIKQQRQQPKQQKLKDTTTNINKAKQQKQNTNNNNNSNSNTKNADIIPLINSPLSSSLSIELDKINNNNKSPVNSFLLANDNNTLLNESFSQVKNDFSTLYTSEYINGIPNDLLKLEIELLFEKIFELVSCYHTSFTKEKATYDKLRKMCNESMKKYQRLYTKNQKMQKRKQQMQMKQTAVKDTNIVDLLLVNLEEIKLFKQIIQKKNITHSNSVNNSGGSDDYTNNETKRKFNHIFHCVFDSNINSNFCLTFCNKEQKQFIINKLRQQQHQP
jgi:hypothetical protein